jgi:hypothetical protein
VILNVNSVVLEIQLPSGPLVLTEIGLRIPKVATPFPPTDCNYSAVLLAAKITIWRESVTY